MLKKIGIILFLFSTSFVSASAPPTLGDYYRAGTQFYLQGQYDLSIRCYETVIAADPQNWKPYQALGSCECHMAIRDYKKSLEINPNNPVIQSFVQEISDGSVVAPVIAAASAPMDMKSLEAYYRAGSQFYVQGKYELSIRCYKAVIAADPQNWKAYQALGSCECHLALTNYKKSLEINPNNPVLQDFVNKVSNKSSTQSAAEVSSATVVATSVSAPASAVTVVPTATALSTPVSTESATPTATPTATVANLHEDNRLPHQGSLTWELGSAVAAYSFQDLISNYAPVALIPPFQTPAEVEFDLGADYTLFQSFQFGAQFQYMNKQPEIIYFSYPVTVNGAPVTTSTTTTWTEACLGGELEGKYLLPLSDKFRFIFEGQVGLYTLVDSTFVDQAATLQSLNLSGSTIGELLEAELEWIPEKGGWALDFGLGYRFLTFDSITYTSTSNAQPQNLTNGSGGNATIDFSGPRFNIGARFF